MFANIDHKKLENELAVLYTRTMRPSIEELTALVNVVESGTITAAARRLRTTKSVVSKRLSDLEERLGVNLFLRAGRTMRPSEAGLQLYEGAVALLANMDRLMENVASQTGVLQGRIRAAGPHSFGTRYLSPLVMQFLTLHPGIEMQLDLDDRRIDLRDGGYDFSIRIGRLEDSALRARKLALSRRGFYCAPSYAQRFGMPRSPQEITRHVTLGYANTPSSRMWHFEPVEGGEPLSLSLPERLIANNGEVLRDAAIAGLGIVTSPHFLACDAVKSGELVEIDLPGWRLPPDTIYAVYPQSVALPHKVRRFIDFLAERFQPPLPWEYGPGSAQEPPTTERAE
jgi:DNA-binding transcriptional LysR family regulator